MSEMAGSPNGIMSGSRMREISFFTNIASAILTAIVLAYLTSVANGVDENSADISELKTEIRTGLAEIKGEVKAASVKSEVRLKVLEENQHRIDSIQRSRTSVFDGMQRQIDRAHDGANKKK